MKHRVTNAKRSERRILDRADHLFSSGCKTILALDKGDEFQRRTGNREVDDVRTCHSDDVIDLPTSGLTLNLLTIVTNGKIVLHPPLQNQTCDLSDRYGLRTA